MQSAHHHYSGKVNFMWWSMKRKFKQWWSTIQLTTPFNLKPPNTKKDHDIWCLKSRHWLGTGIEKWQGYFRHFFYFLWKFRFCLPQKPTTVFNATFIYISVISLVPNEGHIRWLLLYVYFALNRWKCSSKPKLFPFLSPVHILPIFF